MGALIKSERIELHVSPDDKSEIEIAAKMSSVSVSQFIADSAFQRASHIISEHNHIKLTEASFNAVMQALENHPAPNDRLRRAAALSSKPKKGTIKNREEALKGYKRAQELITASPFPANTPHKNIYGIEYRSVLNYVNQRIVGLE